MIEVDNHMFVRRAGGWCGQHIGMINFVHGVTMSVKAYCGRADHVPECASSSSTSKTRREQCYLLLSAATDVFAKYRICIAWLLAGVSHEVLCTEHLSLASDMRRDYKRYI